MILIVWAVIAILVLVSAVLIFMEHEWGFVLGGSTAVILIISYFSAELLVVLLPLGWNSHFDAMAITAVTLFALALIVLAFFAGRGSASRKKQ